MYAGARKEADLKELGAIKNVQAVRLDVTDSKDIAAAVETITKAGRGLYGLVNNAGVGISGALTDTKEEDFDFLMQVNLYGPYRITKAFAPLIVAEKGRITTIGSISGILAGRNSGVYSMSKHAIEAFADSLAAQMAPLGVRVSVIEPGNYNSEIGKSAAKRRGVDPRLGDRSQYKPPDEVAEAVTQALFEPSPKRRYMFVPNQTVAESPSRKPLSNWCSSTRGRPTPTTARRRYGCWTKHLLTRAPSADRKRKIAMSETQRAFEDTTGQDESHGRLQQDAKSRGGRPPSSRASPRSSIPACSTRLQASDAPGPRAFLERLPASMACWRPTRSCAVKSFPLRQSVPPSPRPITPMPRETPPRMSWARLLKQVFDIDVEHCPNCGGALKIIACHRRSAGNRQNPQPSGPADPRPAALPRRVDSIYSRQSEDPKTACQRKPTAPLALSSSERRHKEHFARLPTTPWPSRLVQPWVFYQSEKELTALTVLRYDSGRRKGGLKILSISNLDVGD